MFDITDSFISVNELLHLLHNSLNLLDEHGCVVTIVTICNMGTEAVVAHQDLELARSVPFGNRDIIGHPSYQAQSIDAIVVLHRIHLAGNICLIVKHAAISSVNRC
jgi:hypothetical protein